MDGEFSSCTSCTDIFGKGQHSWCAGVVHAALNGVGGFADVWLNTNGHQCFNKLSHVNDLPMHRLNITSLLSNNNL